jgi:putative phosphoesterase
VGHDRVRDDRARDGRGVNQDHTVGLIADTHGLLRPEALEALRGVSLIVHAGDVGSRGILEALEALAPVRAVRGNTDREPWALRLPRYELVTLGELTLYVHHGHEPLDLEPRAAGCRVVVSGHTHVPKVETRDGVLYVNPGSAGPKRFRLPVTVARLRIAGKEVGAEIVQLSP